MSRKPATLPAPSRARDWGGGALAAGLLGVAMATFWGFTVDDALITCRVAWNLNQGSGHRFNPSGPVVDAVTPLGFEYVLALFAGRGQLAALEAARWLGVIAMSAAAFALGRRVMSRAATPYGAALLLAFGCTAPIAAWAVAGMETGLVTALAIAALSDGLVGDGCAALAAAWRPELAPWCVLIRAGLRLARGAPLARAAASAALPVAAVLLVAVARTLLFGRPAPLSLFAKPSDLQHGVYYAVNAFVQTGLPLLLVAPLTLKRGAPVARAIALAAAAHFVTLALVGGDWMALFRLAVPVLPSCVLGAAELARVAAPWASWTRVALALGASLFLAIGQWKSGAQHVLGDRLRLVAEARPHLQGARAVATLDIGWVSLATSAPIVDLAGVTDERVAMLRGGHTSKRIDDALLRQRQVDALVLMKVFGPQLGYAREVERRVVLLPTGEEFRVVATTERFGRFFQYEILRNP